MCICFDGVIASGHKGWLYFSNKVDRSLFLSLKCFTSGKCKMLLHTAFFHTVLNVSVIGYYREWTIISVTIIDIEGNF